MSHYIYKIVYLYPNSTFRNEMRSDTLWGTICWGIRFLYGKEELNKILEENFVEAQSFPFIVSSGFPFYGEKEVEKKECFFPRPYLPQREIKSKEEKTRGELIKGMKERKDTKKLNYISEELFYKICKGIEGDQLDKELKKAIGLEVEPSDKEQKSSSEVDAVNSDKKAQTKPFSPSVKSSTATHTSLNRLTNHTLEKDGSGQLFHTDENYVTQQDGKNRSGLFFLIRLEKSYEEMIEAVLRWLAHVGIGGDRNIGKGNFDIEYYGWAIPIITKPKNAYLSLSLFIPTHEEMEVIKSDLSDDIKEKNCNYKITFRKGYIGHGNQNFYEKKNLAAFEEGSVFSSELKGHIKAAGFVDKPSPYTVYQNGCAFMIPIHITPPKK